MKQLMWVMVALIVGNIGLSVWNGQHTPKVAYVRSHDLVYGYFGMKEAMEDFKGRSQVWKSNVDTLRADLQRSIATARELAATEKDLRSFEEAKQRINQQQQDLLRYQEAMEKKSQEDEQRILGGVLAQVNAFVERYARKNGYDVVLGTTESGSLLYGETGMDITDELLSALNKDHDAGQ